MKFHRYFLLFFFIPALLFSCKPQQKLPNYLEKLTDTAGKGEVKVPDLRLQKGDRISIQISSLSTLPQQSDLMYNQPSSTGGSGGSSVAGYLIDNNGNILHHRLGVFHALGLTKDQLAAEIIKRLTVPVEVLKDPTVDIRIMNFKITVMGNVSRESVIPVPDERLTILEAIGMAGGITEYGKKTNLRIVREIDGNREIGTIDLSSKTLFESPYYYLVQNDVIIVEATNQKMKESDQAKTMTKISFAFTLITAAATIVTIFTR